LGKDDSNFSYKGMDMGTTEKPMTGSNTSRFFKRGTSNSKYTGSNSNASTKNRPNNKDK
jgi:hypothetical protein